MQACLKGNPILSEEDFDALKHELNEDWSQFAVTTETKCYVTTGVCAVTWNEDFFCQNLSCLPVGAIATLLWLGLGFEVLGALIKINPLVLLSFGAHPICAVTLKITNNFIFQMLRLHGDLVILVEHKSAFALVTF